MPRIIYDPGTGLDVSTTLQASLTSWRSLRLFNLYTFANRVFWQSDPNSTLALWTFTDADFPVPVSYLQLFAAGSTQLTALNGSRVLLTPGLASVGALYMPGQSSNDAGFKFSGLSYEVGHNASKVELTWMMDDAANYFFGSASLLINPQVTLLSMKQAMATYRAFDDCPFWIHRAVADPITNEILGTTLLYRGYISTTEATPDYLKIALRSAMDILRDVQVPNQLIQPSARTSPFLPFPNVATATLGPYPSAGTIQRLTAKTYRMSGTGRFPNDLQDCWVSFNPGASALNFAPQNGLPPSITPGWRIQSNTFSNISGYVDVTFYDPPIVPAVVNNINLFSPNKQTVGAPGFPYIPPPETQV